MKTVRVVLVDDSAVVRGFISRILKSHPYIEVTATAFNGEVGLAYYKKYRPDVILMDIEMPVMNGIEALQKIMEFDPDAKVVMCSTLSTENARITMKAMSLGAKDCIAKPTTSEGLNSSEDFKNNLLRLVLSLGGCAPNEIEKHLTLQVDDNRIQEGFTDTHAFERQRSKERLEAERQTQQNMKPPAPAPIIGDTVTLRPHPKTPLKPKIIAIASSTGGPQALFAVIKHLKNHALPIVITQHMPPTFTAMLANHIENNTGVPCHEGAEGMTLESGHAYVAPGGKHMLFKKDTESGKVTIKLNDGPPENYCKPAADPMFRSLVEIYKGHILGVVLTGMGHDGLRGAQEIVDQGALLIAQNQETSVVWGMPGAVAKAGLCNAVLPIDQIGIKIMELTRL